MSVPRDASVKCQSWGNFLALDIRCFVVNVPSVAILGCFFSKIWLVLCDLIANYVVRMVRCTLDIFEYK